MLSVSSAWLPAVKSSHTVSIRVVLHTFDGDSITLYPTDGEITVDATTGVRRSLSLTLADDGTLTPTTRTSVLSPFAANEIQVWRGITYTDGTTEEVSCGVFRVTGVSVEYTNSGTQLSVSGEDRSWLVTRKPYTKTFELDANTTATTAIKQVVSERVGSDLPTDNVNIPATYTIPFTQLGVSGDEDPWQFCRDVALACGYDLFVDENGTATTKAIPLLSSNIVSDIYDQDLSGVILSVSREFTLDGISNGVSVRVENMENSLPWYSEAWDDDASSPTYRPLFGDQATALTSRLPRSTDQSDAMALAVLQTVMGVPIELQAVPNPALDVRDVISIRVPSIGLKDATDASLGVNAMVDALTIPLLVNGTQTIRCRARKVS